MPEVKPLRPKKIWAGKTGYSHCSYHLACASFDAQGVKLEHILVNRGVSYASWEDGYPTGERVEDNVKVTLATHGKFAKQQAFSETIAEKFVAALPCEGIALASFRGSDGR